MDLTSLRRSCPFRSANYVYAMLNQRLALAAAKQLLALHPQAGGFRLAPGANASQPLDIMSRVDGLVGAEKFAAVDPHNNNKLASDLVKLAARRAARLHFFHVPQISRSEAVARAGERRDPGVVRLAPTFTPTMDLIRPIGFISGGPQCAQNKLGCKSGGSGGIGNTPIISHGFVAQL